MPTGPKPAKPRADFPLFAHACGQWAKKIRGRMHYFGAWADPAAAINRWLDERDDLLAGRTPRARLQGVTVEDLCDLFLAHKRRQVDAGELSPRMWSDYHHACEDVVSTIGATRLVDDLAADDFGRLRAAVAKRLALVSLGVFVQRVRTVFRFGFEAGLVAAPVRFGGLFDKPTRSAVRKLRAKDPRKLLGPKPIRQLVDAAGVQLRAMILLGINCGFGAADCAELPRRAVDLKNGWIDFPRPKTGVGRRCPLWPETAKAIRAAVQARPEPNDPADVDLVFVTVRGQRWVRFRDRGDVKRGVRMDSIGHEFGKLVAACAIELPAKSGFYLLRHEFRTRADGARDRTAVDFIMGHHDPSMGATYREGIEDERLRAVADHVHAWLWPPAKKGRGPAK